MKNLILVLAVLIPNFAQASTTEMSKDNLISVQEKFLGHQQECRMMELNLASDPFLTNLDAEMEEGVREGRVSKEAGERVLKMIDIFLGLSKSLCDQVDHAVVMIDKKLKSDEGASLFVVSEFETQIQSTTNAAIDEMLALAEVPHLNAKEQQILTVIGQVMKRAVVHLLPEKSE